MIRRTGAGVQFAEVSVCVCVCVHPRQGIWINSNMLIMVSFGIIIMMVDLFTITTIHGLCVMVVMIIMLITVSTFTAVTVVTMLTVLTVITRSPCLP